MDEMGELAKFVICNSWALQGALPSTAAPDVRLNPIRDSQFPSKEGVHKNEQTNKWMKWVKYGCSIGEVLTKCKWSIGCRIFRIVDPLVVYWS